MEDKTWLYRSSSLTEEQQKYLVSIDPRAEKLKEGLLKDLRELGWVK